MRIKTDALRIALEKIKGFTYQGNSQALATVMISGSFQKIVAHGLDHQAELPISIKDWKYMHTQDDGTQVEVEENLCINPNHLLKIVQTVPVDEVQLRTTLAHSHELFDRYTPKFLQIGENYSNIPLLDPELFPTVEKIGKTGVPLCTIDGSDLGKISTAVKIEDTMPYKENVLFTGKVALGSDGLRVHAIVHNGVPSPIVVPSATIKGLSKLKDPIRMMTDQFDQVVFKSGKLTVMCKNGHGKVGFPAIEKRLSKPMASRVLLNTFEIKKLLKKAGLVIGKDYRGILLTLDDSLSLEVQHPEKGSFHEEKIRFLSGKVDPPEQILLDYTLLNQAVNHVDGDLELWLDPGMNFIRLGSGNYLALIMTMGG